MAEKNPWRYRCPKGHTNYRANNDGSYYCKRCNARGFDARFDELVDMKEDTL